MEYSSFFQSATCLEKPYPYQERLATKPWFDLLDVPTGLGKTAAVTLAWLYKRGWRPGGRKAVTDEQTPRRLVWCLPMRVLVEQTAGCIHGWLENLQLVGKPGEKRVSAHMLMGGEADLKSWADHPEEDMILVGTQDMLLSRALMRGYGMSRYQWPVHFALLHNDALWVFDEVQLMGAGLPTSAQIEAFRRTFPLARQSRSLWLSATLNRQWLHTVDLRHHLPKFRCLAIGREDRIQAGDRLQAVKHLFQAPVSLAKEAATGRGLNAYIEALCDFVLEKHDHRTQTLVIVNRVQRAQQLFRLLRKKREGSNDLLLHARFRLAERAEQARRLQQEHGQDRILVATQAIEAGVDISAKCLITELAPWASLVQRFGRCNRYGEHNQEGAAIYWLNVEDDADTLPYTAATLAPARSKLEGLASASPQQLPLIDEPRPLTAVVRRKDLLELFNTDPDLSGFDVDVSDYIRDSGTPSVQVFWRDFKDDPNQPDPQPGPSREELCPVSMGQIGDYLKRKGTACWHWDALDSRWVALDRDPYPGMTLLLRAADGGYDTLLGFDAGAGKQPVDVIASAGATAGEAYTDDAISRQARPVELAAHLEHVAAEAGRLCQALGACNHGREVVRAARWHDLGKAHEVFQHTLHACDAAPPGLLAKSPCKARHARPFFRHELASMLGWLSQHGGEPGADLVAYLIAAHHGRVRMSLRAMPDEQAPAGVKRFARGVWEGDILPALEFDGDRSDPTELKLALMEIGEGEQGPSWTERTLGLVHEHGPFRLAWMEALVRIADWRASAAEQEGEPHE